MRKFSTLSSKNLINIFILYILFMIWLFITGCATMIEGPKQDIRVHCTPSEDIDIIVNGKSKSINYFDGQISLDKKRELHFVTFSKVVDAQ